MHLIRDIVLGVGESNQAGGIPGGHPAPRAGPRIPLDKNQLLRARRPNPIDARLVQVEHELLVEIVVLVVGVEDIVRCILELIGEVLAPRPKGRGVGDDDIFPPAVVMRVADGIPAFGGDVVDGSLEVGEVGGVEAGGETAGSETLHLEVDSERVHAAFEEVLHNLLAVQLKGDGGAYVDAASAGPDVVCAENARECRLAELGAGLVNAEVLELFGVGAGAILGGREAGKTEYEC